MKFTILSLLASLCIAMPTPDAPQTNATLSPEFVGGPSGPNVARFAGVRIPLHPLVRLARIRLT